VIAAHAGAESLSAPQGIVLNRTAFLRRLGNDAALVREILELFRADCDRLNRELRGAIETGDAARLSRAAHALKGSLGNLSADTAGAAALRLEILGRTGSLADAADAYRSLETELVRLNAALSDLDADLTKAEGTQS